MNKKVNLLYIIFAIMLVSTMTMAFYQPAKASHYTDTIVEISNASRGVVYSITRVYSQPDDASHVVDVLSPGTHLIILGYNADGTFVEIAREGDSGARGWVSASWISHKVFDSTTLSLTMAYLEPSSKSSVVSILTPGAEVQVLGYSADGRWIAVENPASTRTPIYWVASSDVRLPDVIAQTASLTKFYMTPDTSSRVTNVLPPTQDIILMGRISTGGWYAVADMHMNKFFGWAQSNDLTGGMNKEFLPLIPMR